MNLAVSTRLRPTSHLAAACILLAMSAGRLLAADKTWDGEGANDFWQTSANWDPISGGTAPVAGDSLFFDGFTRLTPNNDFTAGTVFQNIMFNGGASPFTITGNALNLPNPASAAYTVGLNAPYIGGSISNQSPNTQILNLPLTLGNGHHHIVGNSGGGSLNLAAAVTLSPAASVSFSPGVNVTGSGLANVNGILGGWATMVVPTGWAALDGSDNIVEYTGYTDVFAGGAIASAASSNVRIPDSGANVTLAAAGTTDINTLHFGNGPIANQTVDVAAGRILRLGSKGGIFNASRQITGTSRILTIGTAAGTGAVTAGGADNTAGDLYLIETPLIGNTGNQLVMNSRITNNGTGIVTVHTFGHISFPAITGGHTHSGGTYIHGGRIQTTPNINGTGPIYIYPGGQLFLNANGTCTNAIFMAGLGNGESVGNGAIRMGGTGRIITGLITLTADAATANGTFNGRITGPGGLIVGAGSGNGVGTMIIGATNDYSGTTLINGTNATATSGLQMTTGRPHCMPHGAGKGNLVLRGISLANPAVFNLNGTDQTINGLLSFGNGTGDIVTNSAAGAANLFVGDGNANGDYSGVISGGPNPLGLVKIGSGTQTLRGANNYTNGTTANGGTLVFAAPGSFPTAGAQLTINSNATVDLSGAGQITLGVGSSLTMSNGTLVTGIPTAGAAFTVSTFNALGSTNIISVGSIPSISTYPAQFVAIKFTSLNGSLNVGLGSLPVSPGTPFVGYISNNIANNSVDLVVTSGPASMKWQGYAGGSPNSAWDTTTVNWVTFAGSPTLYSDGNFVRFDDSASNNTVTLSQNVVPAGITVSNAALTYTLNDSGGFKIGGAGSLTKQGSGTFVVDNTGPNDFSGGINISAGSLRFGNNDGNGAIPAGNIVNNGDLAVSRTDTITVGNQISGGGTVTKSSSGTLLLSGVNSFTGVVNVAAGTLQVGNGSALGATNGGTIVSSGATLDFNAVNIGLEPVTVSGSGVGGAGALVNNGATVFPAVAFVTLAGDTVFGGGGRWDLRSATTSNPNQSGLTTAGGQPYKITKVGGNQISIVGTTVSTNLGDVEVQSGIFSVEVATTGLGNVNSNLTVLPGATFQTFALTTPLNKKFNLGGDNLTPTVSATSGAGNTLLGSMSITNDCVFNVNNNTVSLNLSNTITGPGKITKVGAGTLILSGNSPAYAGGLQQSAGNVTLSGTLGTTTGVNVLGGKFTLNGSLLGGGVTNAGLTTLAGGGSSAGIVDCSGVVLPGDTNVIGTLTTSGLILENGATLSYELGSTNTVGSGSNDLIVVNGDLVINGNTININPVGLLLTGPGNPYRLFNYTGALTVNSPLNVVGPNNYVFTVDTSVLGQVNIVVSGGPPVWNGGSPTVSNWSDPLNWAGVTIGPGSPLFFAGSTRLNNTNDTAVGTGYGQVAFVTGSGEFVLNGNDITLGGNIDNFATSTQTVVLNMSYGANRSLNGGPGLLKIGGAITNTANNSIITLAGKGILTNRLTTVDVNSVTNTLAMTDTNANWTMMDNSSSTPVVIPTQLDIQAGTFNFGQPGSAPVFQSTTAGGVNARLGVVANSPATLNMINGSLTISARLNAGGGGNTISTLNQSGGTLEIQDVFQMSDSAATCWTALNVTGGLLNVSVGGTPRNMFIASRGTGIVTVANSGVISCATLDMSRNAAGNTLGSVGVVNLNGGILVVSRVGAATGAAQAGGTPTATFNFNGGVLKANASSTTWYQGNASAPTIPIVSTVKSGGAVIDTTNFIVSILEALQHDSTLGATPDGGLRKLGIGALTLTAANTYTGPTVISNGTLLVNGSIGATAVSVESGGTLQGTGNIGSNVTVKAGATISAGLTAAAGNLTVAGNVTMQSGATNFMELNKTAAISDQIRAIAGTATTITYAGTLSLQNLAGTLAAGDSFKLFAASNYLGSFSTITPATPGPNLLWVTSALNTSGTISIAAAPIPKITSISLIGGSVVLSGTNGPASTGYSVLTSTNVALPISGWSLAGTASFDGSGNFSFTNGAPTDPTRFYLLQVP